MGIQNLLQLLEVSKNKDELSEEDKATYPKKASRLYFSARITKNKTREQLNND